ncbi:hypothetical protein R80B4_02862 [Fibrobacteres bacterium R8-0-B4]
MDAKKKVGDATEAVKKAKADATAAVDALRSAGPAAEAAVRAAGIDISMFARTDTDRAGTARSADGDETTERRTKNGFSLGYFSSSDAAIFQAGFVQTRPIGDADWSFVWEINYWNVSVDRGGSGYGKKSERYRGRGVNLPLLFQFDKSVLSLECGAQLDILDKSIDIDYDRHYKSENTIVNAGIVAGGGFQFGFARVFYRFSYGTYYYSQVFGIRMAF